MKRRAFFKKGSMIAAGASLISPLDLLAGSQKQLPTLPHQGKRAKNIIFMVSDGMSTGTLTLADLMLQRKEGRQSTWMSLYNKGTATRALMDTASANALVTDSAAGSSSWGGGVRVNNGALNVNPDGSFNKPILQKFKEAGKSVGCVTSVPITHATPAGFCVNVASRGDQSIIAEEYLKLEFDVMMGAGSEFFSAEDRKDRVDLFRKFSQKGYSVVKNKKELQSLSSSDTKPILGVFHKDGLPYVVDVQSSTELQNRIPTLAEMTKIAINRLKQNNKGFVMQIEGGAVDWAAHSNDAAALIYEQIAFDEAIKEAIDFAEKDGETLVIITTDHGNANPGLFSSDKKFELLQTVKQSNNWILNQLDASFNRSKLIDLVNAAQGFTLSQDEAQQILRYYQGSESKGVPVDVFARIASKYTGVAFGSTGHSSDFVELTMYGPGAEQLPQFVKNTDLHNFMLDAAAVKAVRV
ncbi:alkaline phosphatase [Albibacterium indicum]|uniref:alkaline phosphatase n=1 Tax=Albibacterium indicum TaxID=2292082 RepID=UPI000E5421C6|nr:alkaline phosphatase [Pedobacter indicus]